MRNDRVAPVPRTRPPESGGERELLTGLLDFLRATAVNKVSGLTDEQAFSAPVTSSELTPASVVKHLTGVERFWFSIDFAGADLPWPWPEDDPHGNFPWACPRACGSPAQLSWLVLDRLDCCQGTGGGGQFFCLVPRPQ
jgi:hypothetical protein